MEPLKRSAWAWLPAVAALLAFLVAVPGDFLAIDDRWLVVENPYVMDPSWGKVGEIFNPWIPREKLGNEYLPLRDLSYVADVLLWRALPFGWSLHHVCHLTQSLLYALGALLLALLVAEMTGRRGWALACALLFALHPVHAEAVCWISSRKDLLGTVLVLLSAWAYRCHGRSGAGAWAWYLGAWVAYGGAMLCKSPMMVLPALLVAGTLFFPPPGGRTWLRLLPFFLLALPFQALHVSKAYHGLLGTPLPGIGVRETWLTMMGILLQYLEMLVGFESGSFNYRVDWALAWGPAEVAGALLLAGLVGLAAVAAGRARRGELAPAWALAGWGLCWWLLAMVPVSNLVYRSLVMKADRYLYLPSVGLVAALVGTGLALWGARPARQGVRVAAGVLAVVLAARCVGAGRLWRGDLELGATAVRVDPSNEYTRRALGRAWAAREAWDRTLRCYRQGAALAERHERLVTEQSAAATDWAVALRATGNPREAVALLERARDRFPEDLQMLGHLGLALQDAGESGRADRAFRDHVRAVPWSPMAWLSLGVHANRRRQPEEAARCLALASRLDPESLGLRCVLGVALLNAGRIDALWAALEAAEKLAARDGISRRPLADLRLEIARLGLEARRDPSLPRALAACPPERLRGLAEAARDEIGALPAVERVLAGLDLATHRTPEAEARLRRLVAARPDPESRTMLGEIVRERAVRALLARDLEAAYAGYREALALFPSDVDTSGLKSHLAMIAPDLLRRRFERASACFEGGDLEGARRGFLAALEVDPGFFEAWFNLGLVRTRLGDPAGAAEAFASAAGMAPEDFEVQLRLGDARAAAGDPAGAEAAFRRASALATTAAQRAAAAARLP